MLLIRNSVLSLLLSMFAGLACAAPPVAVEESATPDEAITKVRSAAKFLQDKGGSGFASLNSKDGPWVWKDSYVFAFDCRLDRMVAHPMRPDLVGLPIMQITDNNGKYIFKELCKTGSPPRGGWVEYVWTRPGAGRVSRKLTYTLTADMSFSTGIQVAAGVYDDKVTLAEVTKIAEKMSDPTKYPAH
ncbi:cache domain-containing protein [Propionivibrio sp.]|uniref:cache domain-containing protein n=1 Tax=Propionivibrio sp. TaxID=2212460 RepID=UPI003BF3F333